MRARSLSQSAVVLAGMMMLASPSLAGDEDDWGEEESTSSDEEGWGDEGDDEWGDTDSSSDGGDGGDEWGFDDSGASGSEAKAVVNPRDLLNWSISVDGSLRSDNGLWVERFDDNPFAKARQSFDLRLQYKYKFINAVASGHLAYDAAYLYRREDYDGPTLDAYETLFQIRDLFATLSLGDVELTVGYQILAWGEGDIFSPIDVVNPRDLREPGLADLDDLRIPIPATRLAYFVGSQRFEVMMVHKPDYGYQAPPLGEFSTLRALLYQDGPIVFDVDALIEGKEFYYEHLGTDVSWQNQQYFFRWMYQGAGLDMGFYLASVLDRNGSAQQIDTNALLDPESTVIIVPIEHTRYNMAGVSGALPIGSFVLKGEFAVEMGKPIGVKSGEQTLGFEQPVTTTTDFINYVFSANYQGFTDTQIAIEVSQTFPLGLSDEMFIAIDKPLIGARVSSDFLKETLSVSVVASVLGLTIEQGWFLRAETSYELMDGVNTSIGYITYQPGDELGFLSGLESHDRAFWKVRWDFSVL